MKQQLPYLINRYLEDALTVSETAQLKDLLLFSLEQEEVTAVIRESMYAQSGDAGTTDKAILDKISRKVLEADKVTPVVIAPAHRVSLLRTAWFRYAAAILVAVITTATMLYLTNHSKKTNTIAATNTTTADIAPGSEKAFLTLADGRTIVLDDAGNGTLAKQGNATIIKRSNGQIEYNLKGLPVSKVMMNTMSTPRGGQYQLVLPDGSKVWLNAASSITYPVVFVGKVRKVKITGEAYLEIAKNAKQPFFVHTNKTIVQVLGTSFNINAYENEEAERTSLIEGSVSIKTAITNLQPTILKPGQQASINNSQLSIVNNQSGVTAWKSGFFNFEGVSFAEAMRQLERWYDISVVYEGKAPDIQLLGKLNRNLPLSVMVEGLQGVGIHCRVEGRKLVVMP